MDTTLISRGGRLVKLDRERIVFYDMAALDLIIKQYGVYFIRELYRSAPNPKSIGELELVSVEALAFYLFVGLLAEAKSQGEQLTLEQVQAWVVPMALPGIFNAVVLALAISTTAPVPEGKADAEMARPASPAKQQRPESDRRSTSSRRSGSPTVNSAGRKRSSGKRRSRS